MSGKPMGINVSRFVNNEEHEIDVVFLTPTFLGGADGNAELRTAPFKNLIRRWWRIANGDLSPAELWKKEGELFGQTTGDNPTASKVRIKIEGAVKTNESEKLNFPGYTVDHPEVNREISVESYLGMGPVFWNSEKRQTEYNKKYILPGEQCKLFLTIANTVSNEDKERLYLSLYYLKLFGSIGSRSRNGWGSLNLSGIKSKQLNVLNFDFCMEKKYYYPRSLSVDSSGLLVWETDNKNKWIDIFNIFAEIYVGIRTSIDSMKLNKDIERRNGDFVTHSRAQPRHLLGYPLTHHKINNQIRGETNFERLASPLLFTVKKNKSGYCGRIIHLPYSVNMNFNGNQEDVWKEVHAYLDEQTDLKRLGGKK